MEIRRITKQESELVTELFNKYRIFYKQDTDIKLAKKYIQSRLDNDDSIIFVAFIQNIPVGFTQLYPVYSSVHACKNWLLNDLYVDEDHRKKGIGQELIKTVMEFAKQNGATTVELSTAIDNYTAQSLYENIGFIKQPADNDFFTYKISIDKN